MGELYITPWLVVGEREGRGGVGEGKEEGGQEMEGGGSIGR